MMGYFCSRDHLLQDFTNAHIYSRSEPILMNSVPRIVPGWNKPIVVGRHAHADQVEYQELTNLSIVKGLLLIVVLLILSQYNATEMLIPGPGTVKLSFVPEDGSSETSLVVHKFDVRNQ